MYSFPSTSKRCDASPRAMKMGFPPTLRNARMGEFTPPGIFSTARRNNSSDFVCVMKDSSALTRPGHDAAEPEAHRDLVKAAIQIAHQAALQSQVGLLAGEQILHHARKPGGTPGEFHHAPRYRSAEKTSQEHRSEERRVGKERRSRW